MDRDQHTLDPLHLIREISTRATLAVGLAGIGLIHLLDSIGKYSETRYLFWMYIALIVGSLATAAAVLFSRARLPFSRGGAAGGERTDRLRAQPHHRSAERDGRHRQLD
jgi:hypothetical protein